MSFDNLLKQQRNVTFYKRLGFNVVREATRELGGSGCARSNAQWLNGNSWKLVGTSDTQRQAQQGPLVFLNTCCLHQDFAKVQDTIFIIADWEAPSQVIPTRFGSWNDLRRVDLHAVRSEEKMRRYAEIVL